jgi:hypothetical protein
VKRFSYFVTLSPDFIGAKGLDWSSRQVGTQNDNDMLLNTPNESNG